MAELFHLSAKNLCHIKTVDENGRSLHIFLMSNPVKKPQLDKAIKDNAGPIDYSQFGEIIATCNGRFPTNDVRALMKEKYGIDV